MSHPGSTTRRAGAPRIGPDAPLPAYFGMVMATGIVSLAAAQAGLGMAARGLFAVAWGAYAVLWSLSAWRLARHPRRILGDLCDHQRGPGFFTTVAATAILGSCGVILHGWTGAAFALLVLTCLLWLVLIYAVFTAFTIKAMKPGIDRGISGAWLLAVVATQSIAVLAALLARHMAQPLRLEFEFTALSMWLCGGMLYIWMISLIFYRYMFFSLSPDDLSPPTWINMGAMAISTLAGALLIDEAPHAPLLDSLAPFLKGFTIFYWATGTWWIPMLLILGVWRHICNRVPLTYDPLYWSAVFPLGMYAVGTHHMAEALGLGFLDPLAAVFVVLGLGVWAVTFAGLVVTLARGRA